MRTGRIFAIFAAVVMLAWPLALAAAGTAAHSVGVAAPNSASEHCESGEVSVGGDCSYLVLCAQICTGVIPSEPSGAVATLRLSKLRAALVLSPVSRMHVPPEPPPRALKTA
jgi:hypothetical protein